MAKGSSSNAALQARVTYLHRAATYLSTVQKLLNTEKTPKDTSKTTTKPTTQDLASVTSTAMASIKSTTGLHIENLQDLQPTTPPPSSSSSIDTFDPTQRGLPLHLVTQLKSTAAKAQIRLPRHVKRSICKRCAAVLDPSMAVMENASRDMQGKPWANVLVLTCRACGCVKRYPVGAARGVRKNLRSQTK